MFCRCTINTNKWYSLAHFQNENTATITMEQEGKEYTFDICNDAGYVSNMATSYGGMVYSGSLWGRNRTHFAQYYLILCISCKAVEVLTWVGWMV